ncbi:hypothetical protein EU538_12065, partial [Candidatus Thorarchaeota archaeon]
MKRMNTIAIITLLLCSIAASMAFVHAQSSGDPFIRASWQVVDESQEFEHEDENSQWIFGPQPSVWVGYAENLTSIEENLFRVEVGTVLLVNITIPKSFLGEGNELDLVRFWGSTLSPESPFFVLEYNMTEDSFAMASIMYEPGLDKPKDVYFTEYELEYGEGKENENEYRIVFGFSFTLDIGRRIFWTGMQAVDTNGRPVSPSWLARLESGTYESPPIALQSSVSPDLFSLPKYYYAEIVDTTGDIIHYVGDNETFVVQLMAGTELGEVLVPFAFLDWDSDVLQWVNYTQPKYWPLSAYNEEPANESVNVKLGPMMFLQYNESGPHVVAGYPDISFEWIELDEGIGMWYPFFDIKHNSTIKIEDYFIVDPARTE